MRAVADISWLRLFGLAVVAALSFFPRPVLATDLPWEDGYIESSSQGADGNKGESGGAGENGAPEKGYIDPLDGVERYDVLDIRVEGRIPVTVRRYYQSDIHYNGPLGYGWSHEWNVRIFELSNSNLLFRGPDMKSGEFKRNATNLSLYVSTNYPSSPSPTNFPPDYVVKQSDGSFVRYELDGTRWFFAASGRPEKIQDTAGNQILLTYYSGGDNGKMPIIGVSPFSTNSAAVLVASDYRLYRVEEGVNSTGTGRYIEFTYFTNGTHEGRLSTISDFTGRTWTNEYDSVGNLAKVTKPAVSTNGTESLREYRYDAAHRMTGLFDSYGTLILSNVYDSSGRCVSNWFKGSLLTVDYAPSEPPLNTNGFNRKLTENGTVTIIDFNATRQRIRKTVTVTTNGVRGMATNYVTTYTYTNSGATANITEDGARIVGVIQNCPGCNGNDRYAGTRRQSTTGAGADIIVTWSYEPIYNRIVASTNELGYVTTHVYDYQEGASYSNLADRVGRSIAEVSGMLASAGVQLNLGDINGDGITTQAAGRVIRITHPAITNGPASGQTATNYFTYNNFGLLTKHIDEEENVHLYSYHPVNDPDGDGSTLPGNSDTNEGGFLKQVVLDSTSSAGRESGNNPTPASVTNAYKYNDLGRLTQATDGSGNTTSYELNNYGRVTRITKASPYTDETIEYVYDRELRLVRKEVANQGVNGANLDASQTTTYGFDTGDRISAITNELNTTSNIVTRYERDANGQITAVNWPQGRRTEYVYDERKLLYKKIDGITTIGGTNNFSEAATNVYDYNSNGDLVSAINAEGHTNRFVYDGFNRLAESIDPLGEKKTYAYNALSQVVTTAAYAVDGATLLARTRFYYDSRSRMYQRDDQLFSTDGHVVSDGPASPADGWVTTTFKYDRMGRVIVRTDDMSRPWTNYYDGLSRTLRVADPLGNDRSFAYDKNGNLNQRTDKDRGTGGSVQTNDTWFVYDQLNRLTRITDNLGQTFRYEYDSRNNIVSSTDAKGALISDPLSLYAGQINDAGNQVTNYYDGLNRLTKIIEVLRAGGQGTNAVDTSNSYNSNGFNTVQFAYFDDDQVKSLTDDAGNVTTWEYDSRGRMSRKTYPDTNSTTWTYYPDSALKTITQANGTIISNYYDLANQVTNRVVAKGANVIGTASQAFTYDGLGRLSQATDSDGTNSVVVSFEYDSLGSVLEEIQNGKSITNQYDGTGLRTNLYYPGGTAIAYGRDELGRISTIRNGGTTYSTYSYAGPYLRIESQTNANGTLIQRAYDAIRRVTNHTLSAGGSSVYAAGYSFDRNNNRAFEQIGSDGKVFFVDSVNRLVDARYGVTNAAAEYSSPGSQAAALAALWQMDGVDNFRKVTESNVTATITNTYSVNGLNQYTAVNATNLAYDPVGNLTGPNADTVYRYDFASRLREVEKTNDWKVVYIYDALSRRLERKEYDWTNSAFALVSDQITVRDGMLDVEVYNATNSTLVATIVRGPSMGGGIGGIIAEVRSGTAGDHPDGLSTGTYYYVANYRGDVIRVCNATGGVVSAFDYDAYGRTRTNSGSFTPRFRFSSKEFDSLVGLYYYGYRHYSADLGRWISRDPIGERVGLNLNAYCRDAPYRYIDPDGAAMLVPGPSLGGPGMPGRDCDYECIPYNSQVNSITMGPAGVTPTTYGSMDAAADGAVIALTLLTGAPLLSSLEDLFKDPLFPGEEPDVLKEQEDGSDDKPALSDEDWDRKAPQQVEPGTETIEHQKYNPETGQLEDSTVHYDEYGRQVERTDWTDHGRPDAHTDPHHHTTEYGPGYAPGGSRSGPQPGPAPGDE